MQSTTDRGNYTINACGLNNERLLKRRKEVIDFYIGSLSSIL